MKTSFFRSFLMAAVILVSTTNCGTSSSLLGAASPLMSALGGAPNLSSVTKLLQTPGLDKVLGGALKGPFTLLAPTNEALAALGPDGLAGLSKPENLVKLGDVLNKHLVKGKLDPTELLKGGKKTKAGNDLDLAGVKLGDVIGDKNFNIIPIDKVL